MLRLLLTLAFAALPAVALEFYSNCGATLEYLAKNPDPHKRLVVVGDGGAVTPLGKSVRETWDGVITGRSGVQRISLYDPSAYKVQIAGQIPEFRFGPFQNYGFLKRNAMMSRTHQIATMAAVEAARAAGLLRGEPGNWVLNHDPERTGVFIGATQGDIAGVEEAVRDFPKQPSEVGYDGTLVVKDHYLALKGIPGLVQGHVAVALGAQGPISCPSATCASGSQSIALSGALILGGMADTMVSGGGDSIITPVAMAARERLGVLSRNNANPEEASRPWDLKRDGFVMGEGAGVVIVTTEANAHAMGYPIQAYLAGWGMTSDAASLSAPSPEGQARAMKIALRMAGLAPTHIGYIHAHGTSTPRGDIAELRGLQISLGEHAMRVPISSTKSHMGHLLGGSGAVGAIVAIQAMLNQLAPATRNLVTRGIGEAAGYGISDAELRQFNLVSGAAAPIDVDAVAVNSFGLGGQNVVLVFVRPPR